MSFNPKYTSSPITMENGQFTTGFVDINGALLTNSAVIGNTDDAAWDGVSADATVISLLKKIALNTEPV